MTGTTGWGSLRDTRYLSLTTFRRDGTPVATPVWCAPDGDRLCVITQPESGKAKRLRNDSRVLVAPCDVRGKLKGTPIDAVAVLQDAQGTARTAGLIERRYGLLGKLMMWYSRRGARKAGMSADEVGIEIRPVDGGSSR